MKLQLVLTVWVALILAHPTIARAEPPPTGVVREMLDLVDRGWSALRQRFGAQAPAPIVCLPPVVVTAPPRPSNCIPFVSPGDGPNIHLADDSNGVRAIFIAWLMPMAIYLHEKTGLPASIIIAQAALETEWGRSSLFREANNGFGHSCFKKGSIFEIDLSELGIVDRVVRASCSRPRPRSEGADYLVFRTPADSIYSYVHNLLVNDGTAEPYRELREAVRGYRAGRASRDDILDGLGPYAADRGYRAKLRTLIEYNNLDVYDELESCS